MTRGHARQNPFLIWDRVVTQRTATTWSPRRRDHPLVGQPRWVS